MVRVKGYIIYCLSHTVPFLSRLLPSDVCKIHKSGSKIRMDCTLMDFNEMSWQRGDLSFIFNGENQSSGKVFFYNSY